jgi:hypothetical protein
VTNIDADRRNASWVGTVVLDKERAGLVQQTATHRINGELLDKASIVLVPQTPSDWVVQDGEDSEALHVTVKFLEDPEAFSEVDRMNILNVILGLVRGSGPFIAEVTEWKPLGPNGAQVLVLESGALDVFHEELIHALGGLDAEIPADKYPNFLPHMTVSYDDGADLEEFVGDHVVFDRIRVFWGPEYTEIKLGSN